MMLLLASHSSLRHFTAGFLQSNGPGRVYTSVVVILTEIYSQKRFAIFTNVLKNPSKPTLLVFN